MNLQIYQVLHVLSVILLFAVAFSGLAAPAPERRRRCLMGSGILAAVVLVTGFGMVHVVYADRFAVWMFVKIGVWLAVAVLGASVFRQPSKAGVFTWLAAVLAAVAVLMVYLKPFAM